jgi:hypothetical protein
MRRAIDACHMQHGWLGCWLGLPPLKDWPNDGHLIQDRYCSVGFFLLQRGSLGTLGYGFSDQRGIFGKIHYDWKWPARFGLNVKKAASIDAAFVCFIGRSGLLVSVQVADVT